HHRPHVENVQVERPQDRYNDGRWLSEMTTFFTTDTLIESTYLVATALFILSLKWLSSPVTARRGLFAGEAGMVLAIGGTLLHAGIIDYKLIAIGLVVGTIIGVPLGNVAMTAVPQRTALSHAFGA